MVYPRTRQTAQALETIPAGSIGNLPAEPDYSLSVDPTVRGCANDESSAHQGVANRCYRRRIDDLCGHAALHAAREAVAL